MAKMKKAGKKTNGEAGKKLSGVSVWGGRGVLRIFMYLDLNSGSLAPRARPESRSLRFMLLGIVKWKNMGAAHVLPVIPGLHIRRH